MDAESLIQTDVLSNDILVGTSTPVDGSEEEAFYPDDQLNACDALMALAFQTPPTTLACPEPVESNHDALKHFNKLMALCVCTPTCNTATLVPVCMKFNNFNESERVGFVRSMLYATSCNADTQNQCLPTSSTESRKRRRRANLESVGRTTVGYYIRGRHLCRPAYAAVVQLPEKCVERHAKVVADSSVPDVYFSKRGDSARAKPGVQKIVVAAFSNTFASRNGMECPRGRGSKDESPLRLSPSDTTKVGVHGVYEDDWAEIIHGLQMMVPQARVPSSPISYNLFLRYWQELVPTLRIASTGSDFCDTCTTLKNTMATVNSEDARYESSRVYPDRHRGEARSEFEYYKTCQREASSTESNRTLHLVFDFAEKVLLPRLQKQPGQLHFITGLKFDMFGVSCSNLSTNYIFGLPEGYWPNENTANVVISKLHFVLDDLRSPDKATSTSRCLKLHADNCTGQNKNRYVLWYLAWRVIMGFDNSISLYFLVAGHTKNVCDGAFGHVKRKLRRNDAIVTADMMRIIEESAESTRCVQAAAVHWINWKDYLAQFFYIPSKFKTSIPHVFAYSKQFMGKVSVKVLTTSTTGSTYNLLQKGVTVADVISRWEAERRAGSFDSVITPLEDVPSPHDVTRKNYLKVNILDRYYPNNGDIHRRYFESGSDPL